MRVFIPIFFIFVISFVIPAYSYADSTYVLPYPSVMPGSNMYKLHVLWERLMAYWYFGNLAQFEYNLKESDKYLVEAKTLCEYNQYLFCYKSLVQSNAYFVRVYPFLIKAKGQGKDISVKQKLFVDAAEKHKEVLEKMKRETPDRFVWMPEKAAAVNLPLRKEIDNSIAKLNIKY